MVKYNFCAFLRSRNPGQVCVRLAYSWRLVASSAWQTSSLTTWRRARRSVLSSWPSSRAVGRRFSLLARKDFNSSLHRKAFPAVKWFTLLLRARLFASLTWQVASSCAMPLTGVVRTSYGNGAKQKGCLIQVVLLSSVRLLCEVRNKEPFKLFYPRQDLHSTHNEQMCLVLTIYLGFGLKHNCLFDYVSGLFFFDLTHLSSDFSICAVSVSNSSAAPHPLKLAAKVASAEIWRRRSHPRRKLYVVFLLLYGGRSRPSWCRLRKAWVLYILWRAECENANWKSPGSNWTYHHICWSGYTAPQLVMCCTTPTNWNRLG